MYILCILRFCVINTTINQAVKIGLHRSYLGVTFINTPLYIYVNLYKMSPQAPERTTLSYTNIYTLTKRGLAVKFKIV